MNNNNHPFAGMETFANRLATFSASHPSKRRSSADAMGADIAWPHARPSPEELADAGFYHAPTALSPDNAACFLCQRALDGWEEDDDPLTEHLRLSGGCGWAIMMDVARGSSDARVMEDPTGQRLVEARRATFRGWPHDGKRGWVCKTEKMVEAGWYHCPVEGSEDFVTCPYCKLSLDGWEPKDDPFDEHHRRSNNCSFFAFAKKPAKSSRGRKPRTAKTSRSSSQLPATSQESIPVQEDAIQTDADAIPQPTTTTKKGRTAKKTMSKSKGRPKKSKKVAAEEEPVPVSQPEPETQPEPSQSQSQDLPPPEKSQSQPQPQPAPEPEPEPEPSMQMQDFPPGFNPSKKRPSDAMDEYNLPTTANPSQPNNEQHHPAKKRSTRQDRTSAERTAIYMDRVEIVGLGDKRDNGDDVRMSPEAMEGGRQDEVGAEVEPEQMEVDRHVVPDNVPAAAVDDIDAAWEAGVDRLIENLPQEHAAPSPGPALHPRANVARSPWLRRASPGGPGVEGDGAVSPRSAKKVARGQGGEVKRKEAKHKRLKGRSEQEAAAAAAAVESSQTSQRSARSSQRETGSPRDRGVMEVRRSQERMEENEPVEEQVHHDEVEEEEDMGYDVPAPQIVEEQYENVPEQGQEVESEAGSEQEDEPVRETLEVPRTSHSSRHSRSGTGKAKPRHSDLAASELASIVMSNSFDQSVHEDAREATPDDEDDAQDVEEQEEAEDRDEPIEEDEAEPQPERAQESLKSSHSSMRESLSRGQRHDTGTPRHRSVEAASAQDRAARPRTSMSAPAPAVHEQSSDAENRPPSSRPSTSGQPQVESPRPQSQPQPTPQNAPQASAPPTTTKEVTLPTRTPPKPALTIPRGQLRTRTPWTEVDVDEVFLPNVSNDDSADPRENDEIMQLFREAKGELTAEEKEMTVEEWVRHNAEMAERKLRGECERLVGIFESEGGRAMRAIEGIECD